MCKKAQLQGVFSLTEQHLVSCQKEVRSKLFARHLKYLKKGMPTPERSKFLPSPTSSYLHPAGSTTFNRPYVTLQYHGYWINTHTQDPVSWGCRIHRLHLCRGVRLPPNECPDMTLSNLIMRPQQCWSFGECGYNFIAIAPRYTLTRSGNT